MKRIVVVGVTSISDLYPNIKYKIPIIKDLCGEGFEESIINTSQHFSQIAIKSNLWSKIKSGISFLAGHLRIAFKVMLKNKNEFYVLYPGIFLVFIIRLIQPRKARIALDAFISLYDTVVFDRKLISEKSLLAKLLYIIEKKAFSLSDYVLVDTKENGDFYAELFNLSAEKFVPIPFSIPKFEPLTKSTNQSITCLFVGTFVPLQGIKVISEAIKKLRDHPIKFIILGDGQDAAYIRELVEDKNQSNVYWSEGFVDTPELIEKLKSADICLGIFGHSDKTDRVIPFKIYCYLASAKPVLTARTSALRQLKRVAEDESVITLIEPGDSEALASELKKVLNSKEELANKSQAAHDLYKTHLGRGKIEKELTKIIDALCSSK